MGDHFSKPHDANLLSPKNRFLGRGPLFETLRCQFFKSPISIFRVGDHFSKPYDANFLRPEIDFLGGGPLLETLRCQLFKSQKSFLLGGGPLFETTRCQFFKAGKPMFWVGDYFSRPHDANFQGQEIVFVGLGTTFRDLTMPIC